MNKKSYLAALFLIPTLTFAAKPVKPCKGAKCTPPPVASLVEVVGGESFTCYLQNAAVKCLGAIGNYNKLPVMKTPTIIPGLESGVTKIAAGPFNLCAIKNNDLYCFGDNDYNQLAQGNYSAAFTPPKIISSPILIKTGVKDMAMGFYHGCAIAMDDSLHCWGDNPFGAFGDGTYNAQYTLPAVQKAVGVKDVVISEYHTTILMLNGDVMSAGYNSYGILGIDYIASSDVLTFSKVNLPGLAKELIDGHFHTLVRLENGATYSYGYGGFGELANGLFVLDNKTPKLASLIPTDAVAVFAQNYRSCYLNSLGKIFCMGSNRDGILTIPQSTYRSAQPVELLGLQGVPKDMIKNISGQRGSNSAHACAVTSLGIECWGNNEFSQLGGEPSEPILAPILIQPL